MVVLLLEGGVDGGENGGGNGGGKKWRRWVVLAGQGAWGCYFMGCSLAYWLEKEGGKKNNERERRKWVFLYIRVKFIITILPSIQSKRNAKNGDLRLHAVKPASGLLKLDAEINPRPGE